MISALLYDREKEELDLIDAAFKEVIAMHSGDECRIMACDTKTELDKAVADTEIADFNFIEAVDKEGIDVATMVRQKYPTSALLLVVSDNMMPTEYIKPSIMASALIMRPSNEDDIKQTLKEFVNSVRMEEEADDANCYYAENSGTITRIPFNKILYIEARQKRVFFRLKREEYAVKESLESVIEKLPDNFIRCHRGYVLNKNKITKYYKTESIVEMESGITIPVSRTFKQAMRNL